MKCEWEGTHVQVCIIALHYSLSQEFSVSGEMGNSVCQKNSFPRGHLLALILGFFKSPKVNTSTGNLNVTPIRLIYDIFHFLYFILDMENIKH